MFSVDTGDDEIRMAIDRVWIGPEVTSEPIDLSVVDAYSAVRDPVAVGGWRLEPPRDAGGVLYFEPPADGDPPVLAIEVPGDIYPYHRVFSLPDRRDLRFPSVRHARADVEAAPPTAMLDLDIELGTMFATGDGLTSLAVGSWSFRQFSGAELPGELSTTWDPAPLSYASWSPRGAFVLGRLVADDVVVFAHARGGDLVGVMVAPPFDMSDGTSVVAGLMTPIVAARPFAVDFNAAAIRARITDAAGASLLFGHLWSAIAAPGHRYGSTLGPTLATHAIADSALDVTGAISDPFVDRGWPATLLFQSVGQATIVATSPPRQITLYVGINHMRSPDDTTPVTHDLGLATSLTIDGVTLGDDELIVSPVATVIEFAATYDGACDLFDLQITVEEPARLVLANHSAVEPRWLVPAAVLRKDETMVARVICLRGGFPSLADGDLRDRELPTTSSYRDVGVFRVMSP